MATIDTKGLPQMLADQAAAAQAAAGRPLSFTDGSLLRLLAEGFSAIALWLQAMILRVLAVSRLATSSGEDVESFVGDFGLIRTPATFAQGTVTLSRNSPAMAAFVPAGSLVRSADASATFQVAAGGVGYDAGAGGYTIPAGAASLNVPVAALTAGTVGNVDAGTVTLLASALSGVDAVTNAAPMTGGAPAETDQALKARFPLYLASLSKATRSAIDYAVSQVQPGIRWSLIEGEDPAGNPVAAHFLVAVDDGTGSAPGSLITRTYQAVDAVRGLGITFGVVAAVPVAANVSLAITTSLGADHAAAVGRVAAAVIAFERGLDIGGALPFTRLAQVAYDADPAITRVSSVTLNGGTADLAPTGRQVIVPGTTAVS